MSIRKLIFYYQYRSLLAYISIPLSFICALIVALIINKNIETLGKFAFVTVTILYLFLSRFIIYIMFVYLGRRMIKLLDFSPITDRQSVKRLFIYDISFYVTLLILSFITRFISISYYPNLEQIKNEGSDLSAFSDTMSIVHTMLFATTLGLIVGLIYNKISNKFIRVCIMLAIYFSSFILVPFKNINEVMYGVNHTSYYGVPILFFILGLLLFYCYKVYSSKNLAKYI